MFVLACSFLSIFGAFIGSKLFGEFGFFLGMIGGAILGWYYLGNILNVDDW
jgi:hypothetical protein